ncbi:MAG: porin [Prevotella sp.]|nr:porin [Prevotella sp.]
MFAVENGTQMLTSVNETAVTTETAITDSVAQKEQTTWEKIISHMPKFSGYLQTGWNWSKTSATGSKASSSFQAKRLRLIMDGNVGEKVDFRLQIEAFNGIAGSTNGNGQKTVQVMDAFATLKLMPELKIRAGQFYTPLGYENYDISPKTLETVDFSNIVYRMACRNPYEYNVVDYGRDLGVMIMGDAFDSGKGFRYLHYDLALTNGSLPTKDDRNSSKDIYASVTVRPMKYFNIKTTYNYGRYSTQNIGGTPGVPGVPAVPAVAGVGSGKYSPMNRMVVGAWYNDPQGLDLRAEYGLMKSKVDGIKFIDEQGAYFLAAYHLNKWLPMVRWDMYKDSSEQGAAGVVTGNNKTTTNNYNRILLGVNYQLYKNVTIQFNYHHYFYNKDVEAANGYAATNQIQLMGRFAF